MLDWNLGDNIFYIIFYFKVIKLKFYKTYSKMYISVQKKNMYIICFMLNNVIYTIQPNGPPWAQLGGHTYNCMYLMSKLYNPISTILFAHKPFYFHHASSLINPRHMYEFTAKSINNHNLVTVAYNQLPIANNSPNLSGLILELFLYSNNYCLILSWFNSVLLMVLLWFRFGRCNVGVHVWEEESYWSCSLVGTFFTTDDWVYSSFTIP